MFRFKPWAALAVATLATLGTAASSWASVLFTLNNGNSYNVEYVTGTGSNKAILEIAFSSTDYYLFGYQWSSSPAPSASDMLLAVDVAKNDGQTGATLSTTLNVTSALYSWGLYITGMSYQSSSANLDWENYLWWGYLTSATGVTWTSSDVGSSDVKLTDGAFEAFAYGADPAGVGILPVPEPTSLGLLIIALLMKQRRR